MKIKSSSLIKVIIFSLITIIISNFQCGATIIPVSLEITTESQNIAKVTYQNYEITASKIVANNIDSIGYCLEIDKNYPSGETFNLTADAQDEILGILKSGYPDYTYEQLGVLNDDEAYFATQIALWCYLEKYNVNELSGNTRIIDAIHKIYDGANKTRSLSDYEIKTYYSNPEVQNIIMLFKKDYKNDEEIIIGK